MSADFLSIHPDNPQPRFIKNACNILRNGGVAVIPTDSSYALCCLMGQKDAMERIARIRQISKNHNFTLICRDLSELSTYAKVDNSVFRLLKNNTPGAYTFILPATKDVPRRVMNEKRRTIGLRVPQCRILEALLDELNEPLMSCSLIMPGEDMAESDPVEINDKIGTIVDVIIDGGVLNPQSTTVIRFEDGVPEIRRVGIGDPSPFE
ncbi:MULTISPECIES: L-threonylcarbamoyladenylate synthase [unclassified Anaerobiospirillum]|uniref:L-threonylcarbamoyladenylate synthase n=1 Tax=unclassified Anaerobiospirillum TaxID=2647410 RepID=UPI001FF3B821|nr:MULTISPECIES: L-threonylcarbamoyladenylate synthase [unclassified Anaerobiospirillum]MCK0526976.1 L-threonylcarbamoyladenylate synthase [Anaerobiospirillum sp. NML120449]MCK0534581.1 L-threonylcarbamoyladenylate synthase [Anaerobiospirillum sp. NML120511]MCK0540619.1 L-threonylcarbamoyladenylate synthase [Anaerobiospirillum sp. NML02-A-032]